MSRSLKQLEGYWSNQQIRSTAAGYLPVIKQGVDRYGMLVKKADSLQEIRQLNTQESRDRRRNINKHEDLLKAQALMQKLAQ